MNCENEKKCPKPNQRWYFWKKKRKRKLTISKKQWEHPNVTELHNSTGASGEGGNRGVSKIKGNASKKEGRKENNQATV